MDGSPVACGRDGTGSAPLAERAHTALLALCQQRGFAGLSDAELCRRAGVSEAEFARSYPDLDACFAELWGECRDELLAVASAALRAAGSWREGMRDAAWSCCGWLQENPSRARLLFVEVSFAGEEVRAGRDRLLGDCAELVHLAARERDGARPVAREHADAIAGAIWQRAATAVHAGAFDSLPRLVPQLMYTAVLPYLGDAAAREELRRGPADIARHERREEEGRAESVRSWRYGIV